MGLSWLDWQDGSSELRREVVASAVVSSRTSARYPIHSAHDSSRLGTRELAVKVWMENIGWAPGSGVRWFGRPGAADGSLYTGQNR